MLRLKYGDAIVEMTELAADILADIRQQAVYYRASVYKDETIKLINRKVDNLALIVRILKDSDLNECIADFRCGAGSPMEQNGTTDSPQYSSSSANQPIDCQLTVRVMRFLIDAEQALDKIRQLSRKNACQNETRQLVKNIVRNRRELAGMTRHGSKAWSFLQSI